MKHTTLVIVLAVMFTTVYAQHEADVWQFGEYSGFSFNTSPPTVTHNSAMFAWESCASICDRKTGKLLLYTDGQVLYNSKNQILTSQLKSRLSSTQGSLIIAKPGSKSIYYVFCVNDVSGDSTSPKGLWYTVVDMNANNGNGRVVLLNIELLPIAAEKLTSYSDCNRKSCWIVAHSLNKNEFYSFLLTKDSIITKPVISTLGLNTNYGSYGLGALKISPNGTKVCMACQEKNLLEVFDFNMVTGKLSNSKVLIADTAERSQIPYNFAFSNNSTNVYAGFQATPKTGFGTITQFDISNEVNFYSNNITNKQYPLFTSIEGLQNAPDGKIYVSRYYNREYKQYVGVITNPDSPAVSCGYIDDLGSDYRIRMANFPNFPSHYWGQDFSTCYKPLANFGYDTVCSGERVNFQDSSITEEDDVVQWQWYFPGGVPSTFNGALPPPIKYVQGGDYPVKLVVANSYGSDTVEKVIHVLPEFKIQSTPKEITICKGNSGKAQIVSSDTVLKYSWEPRTWANSPDSATTLLLPRTTTMFYVTAVSKKGCSTTDSILVHVTDKIVAIARDTTICEGESVVLAASGGAEYSWRDSTGKELSKEESIQVTPKATSHYTVYVGSGQCSDSITIQVKVNQQPKVQVIDTTICSGNTVQLYVKTPQPNTQYVWYNAQGQDVNTGSTFTTLPSNSTMYTVKAINQNGCYVYDTCSVIVNTPVTISTTADTSICAGFVAVLKVTNAQQAIQYTWTDEQGNILGNAESITVQPTQSQLYTVKGVRNGCEGAAAVRIVVQPIPSVLVRDTSICQGQTATVKVVNPDANNTYTWKDDKGNVVAQSTEYTTTPQTTSIYSVTVRSSEGCESSVQATITIEPKTSVHVFVAPIRDSIEVDDTVRVQVFAQADRVIPSQQIEFDIQTERDVMDIPTSVHSGAWQTLHINTPITLGTAPAQVYEFTGKTLVTQTRQATVSIQNLSTQLNPECRIQTSKETTFITGTACANDILKFKLVGTELLLSPNPSNGEITITSEYDIEELQVINSIGTIIETPSIETDLQNKSNPKRNGAMSRTGYKVQIETNGLYFIRTKVNGEWIIRSVVVQR